MERDKETEVERKRKENRDNMEQREFSTKYFFN